MRKSNNGLKKVLFAYGGVLLVLLVTCVIVYAVYNNKIKESARQSLISAQIINDVVPNNNLLEEASAELGKTINEVIEETNNNTLNQEQNDVETNTENNVNTIEEEKQEELKQPVIEEPVKKELEFMKPVEGEIIKEFAIDNLVYSATLQEWIVHKGIDIKAPRTTVVKSAEEGTVKAIKNDPRYGLTIIIEHSDGFKTIYSNLLTTEFVKEGETVSKGQSLGTIGNSAAFEIADEPHLHFELLKNEETQDPMLYLK